MQDLGAAVSLPVLFASSTSESALRLSSDAAARGTAAEDVMRSFATELIRRAAVVRSAALGSRDARWSPPDAVD